MKKNDNEIKTYSDLVKIRNILKQAQQLSWNITQFDKRYPLEEASFEDYSVLLESYTDFINDLYRLINLFENLEKENENENNQNKILD